ncbi:hypothetical protein ONS95_001101 [Cadophora gregata]|uniref:uncharacterized protein n=1 Tax=Cadophora gregata TaxID=51156 RepID=UPI0026DCFBC3|nr:uncharacterized protein ONS95_001101 [Cadophora gregata]KAK0129165.1 hypothetical protein ONS95_001101 [Cadophora gregata]
MPFPSKACKTCKARRVKCDETRPRCNRCLKADRECYGMPTVGEPDHVYHLENAFASGVKKRPRGPRPRPTPAAQPTAPRKESTKQMSLDLKTQAVQYYMEHHLCTFEDAPDLVKGVYDFPSLWISLKKYPILDLAISSIALAVFSRAKDHPAASIEANESYHRLLKLTQQTIFSLDESNVDICLLAIFFMGRYEQVVHSPEPSHLQLKFPLHSCAQSFSHHDGNLAILKSWKEHSSEKLPATDVIKRVRRGMIRSALLRNIALPQWIVDGSQFGERGLELEYDRLMVRLVEVRERLTTIADEQIQRGFLSPEFISLAKELDTEAQEVDLKLQDWATRFPKSWAYQRQTLEDPLSYPTKDFYSSNVLTYQSLGHAAVWNLYFATRILVNCTRLSILEFSDHDNNKQRTECLNIINNAATDLASSIPFCRQIICNSDNQGSTLGPKPFTINHKASEEEEQHVTVTIVWPLSIAAGLGRMAVKPRAWFRAELARIGRIIHDSILADAENNEWLQK